MACKSCEERRKMLIAQGKKMAARVKKLRRPKPVKTSPL